MWRSLFDYRFDEVAGWIRSKGFRSVAIQLPEGLKIRATEVADELFSRTGVPVTIIGNPCYGTCDVHVNYKNIADGLVHYGHARMPSITTDEDILFIEASVDIDMKEGIEKIADSLPENIGLIAAVQYTGLLDEVKAILESFGKKTIIGKGDARLIYPGQVLGCNCSAAKAVADGVDCFLYIGEGDFHPLTAAFGVSKDIIAFNPLTYELRPLNEIRDRMLRKRFAAIETAKAAASFLVIVSTKVGQKRDAVAGDIMKKLISAGKKVYKVAMEEVTPDSLLAYRVDAYVNTACPRLVTDDSGRYDKPILTPQETEVAIGLRDWDEYEFDEICD